MVQMAGNHALAGIHHNARKHQKVGERQPLCCKAHVCYWGALGDLDHNRNWTYRFFAIVLKGIPPNIQNTNLKP